MSAGQNRRILVIDDNASIHADYRKILGVSPAARPASGDARAAFFGEPAPASAQAANAFELDTAYQGEEGLESARAALAARRPYALAFVDVRMPPGIDGVEVARRLLEIDAELQIVICTAFADYSWEELGTKLGRSDRVLILKKPFDPIEVVQLATALTEKWNTARRERENLAELRRAEQEARAYAASLSTFNRALVNSKAAAEASSAEKSAFLARLAALLDETSREVLAALESGSEPALDAAGERCSELRGAARNLALEAGLDLEALVPAPERCSPGTLLEEVAARWRPRAEQRGLRLACDFRGALPATIECDRRLVEGILDALVENALRYTVQGGVRLEVHMPLADEGGLPLLVYSVIDTGPGIAASEQPRVFEPLLRDGRAPGAHFALHTARRLARFLGGDLEVESTPGAGATFRLSVAAGDLSGVEFGLHPPGALPSPAPQPSAGETRS